MSPRPSRSPVPVSVTVRIPSMMALLLDEMAAHLGKTRDETVIEALRALFVKLPRRDE
jgi:hypothetical protein